MFLTKSNEAKPNYYVNMGEDLLTSNPGQWYSKIKRMASIDPSKDDKVFVQELIANQFVPISNEYATQILKFLI